MNLGFIRSYVDPNLYFKVEKDIPIILVLYVDDHFLTSADPLIYQCKRDLTSEFEMKDLGLMHYFLGLEVWQNPRDIFPSQGKYIMKLPTSVVTSIQSIMVNINSNTPANS